MATILLGAIGSAIGTSIGGTVLGIGAAAIGKAVGSVIGRMIDQSVIAMITPDDQHFGPEVGRVGLALPREGEMLARGVGWQKLPARIIWPEDLHFSEESETVSTGGKGAQNKSSTTTYFAEVTIAVAIREGVTDLMGRVWADGSLVDLSALCSSVTLYKGSADQYPDSTLEASDGAGNVPDWRGVTYLVLEGFNLSSFGNRIPQLEFETFTATRGLPETYTGVSFAATAGEFGFDPLVTTERVVETIEESGGSEDLVIDAAPINNNVASDAADVLTSLDYLKAQHPQIDRILIELPWFGDDLRAGSCLIKPRVEFDARETAPDVWRVSGIVRGSAVIVSQVDGARAYAGTPSDAGLIRFIQGAKARGYSVTLSPMILMDIAAGNGLADPYGALEQSAFPDRGRITCAPAPGEAATVDKTAAAQAQIDDFFGSVDLSDFSITDGVISYGGAVDDWGYRRFIFHCAQVVIAAGGVDDFLIGSGLSGVTRVRSDTGVFPGVDAFRLIAADLRAGFDAVRDTYSGANWPDGEAFTAPNPGAPTDIDSADIYTLSISNSIRFDVNGLTGRAEVEKTRYSRTYYAGSQGYFITATGSGSGKHFVDFPLPDGSIYDVEVSFEDGRLAGVGGYGATARQYYVYEIDSDSASISSLFYGGDPWPGIYVTHAWFPRESGLLVTSGGSDALRVAFYHQTTERVWRELVVNITKKRHVHLSYAADWREYGAYDPNDGSGDLLFALDPLWSDANIDYVAINWLAPLADNRDGDLESGSDLVAMKAQIESGEYYDFNFASAADRQARIKTDIADLTHGEPWIKRHKDLFGWWSNAHHNRPLGVRDAAANDFDPSSKKICLIYGCPAIDRGANEPAAISNPNSDDYALPHFSNGARDDNQQAAYLRAIAEFWAADGRGVVDMGRSCVMGWDARPWPVFPHTDLWPDAADWPVGFSIAGRRIVDLAAWLSDELSYRDLDHDLDQIVGAFDGITITNLAGFMAIVGPILNLFSLDASEIDGKIVITSRILQKAIHTIDLDAVLPLSDRDRFKVTRGNPSSIPAIAHLTHRDVGHEYDDNTVNSQINVTGKGESYVDAPVLIDPQIARALVRTLHLDGIVALDGLECELPPSWLNKLLPGRAVLVDVGNGPKEFLIQSRDIAESIKISARRLDRAALRPIPSSRVGYVSPGGQAINSSALAMPDLPWIKTSDPAHDMRAALWVSPAQGSGLMRSLSESTGFETVSIFSQSASLGVITADLARGGVGSWDRGNVITLRLFSGVPISKTEAEVRAGKNWLAVRTDAILNNWELIGFANVDLVGDGVFEFSHLLRGLRGSQVIDNIAAGAMVVLLEGLPFADLEIEDLGAPLWWSGGPSAKPRTDASWTTRQATPRGVGLKPFAPVRAKGEIVSGDLVLTWARQDRDPRAMDLDRVEIPMSEETLAFVITIGAATWTASAENLTILAVDLPAFPFDVSIQQISADIGAGYATILTVES